MTDRVRNLVQFAAVLLIATAFLTAAPTLSAEDEQPATAEVTSIFKVTGMTCTNCEALIRSNVQALDGVSAASADHMAGTAEVTYDPAKVTTEQVIQAITNAGYGAELLETKE